MSTERRSTRVTARRRAEQPERVDGAAPNTAPTDRPLMTARESERVLALYRASAALTAQTAEPDAVLDEVLHSAVRLLDAGSASLYLWDAPAELLRCVRNWQVPPEDTTPD